MKIVHTSDWQIGKVFRYVDKPIMALLQEARVEAISRIGQLATESGAKAVLVAGDMYDMEGLRDRTLDQPIERMRTFSTIEWHLIPGNHDPHRPDGLWTRVQRKALPANIKVHLTPEPQPIAGGVAWVLPAPLQRRRTSQDITSYMNDAPTPEGTIRIGLAHGSIKTFGSDETAMPNYISPNRPMEAELAYLALGDWHGFRQINDRCCYSGTPETDGFDVEGGGYALVVDLPGPNAAPSIEKVQVGRYRWFDLDVTVSSADDIDVLENRLRGLDQDPDRVLVRLAVSGALSLADRQTLQDRIVESVSAALHVLLIDDDNLVLQPTEADLDAIDRTGFVRTAVNRLKTLAEDPANPDTDIARLALQRLYVEHLKQGQP